jgi:heme O synthase-like polyprenyltransferase
MYVNIFRVAQFILFGIMLSVFGLTVETTGYWVLLALFTIHGIFSYVEGLKRE